MIVIYTDGSAKKNGSKFAEAGFGVVVYEGLPGQSIDDYTVIDAYTEKHFGATNNQMELMAILWAMENYGSKTGEFFSPIVYSDSMYCVNSFTNWIKNWKANGWVRTGNKPLENKDLILEYDRLTNQEGLRIDLRYIKGHNGTLFNELADQMAKEATKEAEQKYLEGRSN